MVEHASLQVTIADRYRTARTKQNIAKRPTVFRQRELAFGSAIQVVEHRLREPALRQTAQILDIDDA
jgi:hypothetical protein